MIHKHLRKPVVAALTLLGVYGCQTMPSAYPPNSREVLPILWDHADNYSQITKPLRVVARDASTLSQLPLVEVPVDFKKQMVLIAAMGPVNSDQLGIRITRVERIGTKIKAEVVPVHPGEQKHGGIVRTSPYHIVVVPKCDLNVEGFTATVPKNAMSHTAQMTPGRPPSPVDAKKK